MSPVMNEPVIVPTFGFWHSLWLVLTGERLNDWSVLHEADAPERRQG